MFRTVFKEATANPCRRMLCILGLTSAVGIAMLVFRLGYSGRIGYWSLPWDLFLAWVPVPFAIGAARRASAERKPWVTMFFFAFLWLLFFPNAPYLLTQFMHLHPSYGVYDGPHGLAHLSSLRPVPLWYDVMMLTVYAWTGLLLGFLSLHLIHRAATQLAGPICGWAVVLIGTGLCAFGVSLGRFERWNSWDMFSRPLTLLDDILERVINPFAHPRTSAVTIVLASFLLLAYLTLVAVMALHVTEADDPAILNA